MGEKSLLLLLLPITVRRSVRARVCYVELQLLCVWFNPAKSSPFWNHRRVSQYLTVGARFLFEGQTQDLDNWKHLLNCFPSWLQFVRFFFWAASKTLCRRFYWKLPKHPLLLRPQDDAWHLEAWHRNAPIGCSKRMLRTKSTEVFQPSDSAACCRPCLL